MPNVATIENDSNNTYISQYGSTVVIQGYYYPGDGGGGTFVNAPLSVLPKGYCMSANGSISQNSNQIVLNQSSQAPAVPSGLDIDMTVLVPSISGFFTSTISAYSVTNQNITLSTTYTGTAYSGPIYFGGNNMGTTLTDKSDNCFLRTTTTYSQKEWGAYSNGNTSTDDRLALQAWLYANQPHIAVAGNSIIGNTLYCGVASDGVTAVTDGGIIQGPPPNAVAEAQSQPAFTISANDATAPSISFPGTYMLVLGQSPCALSAVGLVGNAAGQRLHNHYSLVEATQHHNSIFNHSQLSGGWDGLDCAGAGADVEVYDSSIAQAASVGLNAACPNVKIQRNVVGTNGTGIFYSGTQGIIADNVIEQNGADGLLCSGGMQLAANGNYFDNNGKMTPQTYNLHANGCNTVSITGNQFHRSAAATEGTGAVTAQVWFDGQNDSVSMSGNVNFVDNDSNYPVERPDYDVELGTNGTAAASVTNFSYADSPTPQNAVTSSTGGIFGPNALAALGPLLLQNVQQNYFSGLIATNAGGQKLSINPGSAADSSNAQLIRISAACQVNLGAPGIGGLDVGGIVSPSTQYNFFILAQGGYGSGANCIASTGTQPNFVATATSGGVAAPSTSICGFVAQGSYTIVTVSVEASSQCSQSWNFPIQNPFGGLAVGDYVTDADNVIPAGTTIQALNSISYPFTPTSISSGVTGVGVSSSDVQNLFVGEMVGNSPSGNWISESGRDYITTVIASGSGSCGNNNVSPPCITLSVATQQTGSMGSLVASGGYTITLKYPVNCSGACPTSPDTITVYNDRYRLVASLYTATGQTPPIEQFVQNGDTFYLNSPAADVNINNVGTSPVDLVLGSVPQGSKVEALGRCVASQKVHLFNRFQSPPPPASFPAPPGFDTAFTTSGGSTNPIVTAFPYRIYTDTSRTIAAEASASNTTLYCMTDGWVLHRGP